MRHCTRTRSCSFGKEEGRGLTEGLRLVVFKGYIHQQRACRRAKNDGAVTCAGRAMPDDSSARKATSSQQSQSQQASSRAGQINDHLSSSNDSSSKDSKSTSGRRKRAGKKDDLPADYSDLLGQMDTMRKWARNPSSDHSGYRRQKESGKLHVRERIALLLDKKSFREIGSVSGKVKWKLIEGIREEPVSVELFPM